MKQRLGIAMALLGSPKLLILDEPTNGLDPAGIQEMRALIRNMPAATGATVLISSHLLGEMEQMVEPVSYTHLDVYKRQTVHSMSPGKSVVFVTRACGAA